MSPRNIPMQAQTGTYSSPMLNLGANASCALLPGKIPGVFYFILVFIYAFHLLNFLYSCLSVTSCSTNYIFHYILVGFRYAFTFVYLSFLFIYFFLCTSSLKYPILMYSFSRLLVWFVNKILPHLSTLFPTFTAGRTESLHIWTVYFPLQP